LDSFSGLKSRVLVGDNRNCSGIASGGPSDENDRDGVVRGCEGAEPGHEGRQRRLGGRCRVIGGCMARASKRERERRKLIKVRRVIGSGERQGWRSGQV
jgi:hypothetical protein